MKVAIIGAGTAGLACALELKRQGIEPHVYEKRTAVGHPLEHAITTFNLFNPSHSDPLKRLERKYGIPLHPLYPLKEVSIEGPSKTTTLHGNLGVVFKRGLESYSLENQIFALAKVPIEYNTYVDIEKIRDEYDFIVVSTGDESIAKQLGVWNSLFSLYVKAATVIGSFTPGTMKIWMNTDSSKNWYTFLLPHSEKEASLIFHVTHSRGDEMEYYWKEFLITEEVQYKIVDTREGEYNIGHTTAFSTPDHIYFAGGAGGFMEDVLGFGISDAVKSGVCAAKSILQGKNFDKLLQDEIRYMKQMQERLVRFAAFDSEALDKFVAFFTVPVVKRMLFRNPSLRK